MKCKLCEKGDALGVTKCSYAFMIGLFSGTTILVILLIISTLLGY